MNEKTYRTMSRVGGGSIALGVISILIGITTGVLMILGGACLMKQKYDITI